MSIMLSKVWFQASKIMSFTEMSASPQRLVTCQQSSSISSTLNVQYPSSTSWPGWRMISIILRYSYHTIILYTIILSILKLRLLIVRGWGNYQLPIFSWFLLHSIVCNSTYTYSIHTWSYLYLLAKKGRWQSAILVLISETSKSQIYRTNQHKNLLFVNLTFWHRLTIFINKQSWDLFAARVA